MKQVLVVGSVHLDIFGDTSDNETVDKKGEATFFVGGTGFNIACNIATQRNGEEVSLYSYLKRDSLITNIIKTVVERSFVKKRYLFRRDKILDFPVNDGAFLAHRDAKTGKLISAVSSMFMNTCNFLDDGKERKKFLRAVRKSDVVVTECNVQCNALEQIMFECDRLNKPLFIAGVSQSKMADYVRVCRNIPTSNVACFAANRLEFSYAMPEYKDFFEELLSAQDDSCGSSYDAEMVRGVLDNLCAKTAILSDRFRWVILTRQGDVLHYPAPEVVVRTETGAGDALFSAFICYVLEHNWVARNYPIEILNQSDAYKNKTYRFIQRALRAQGATPSSAISISQDWIHENDNAVLTWLSKMRLAIVGYFTERSVEYGVLAVILVFAYLINVSDLG